MIFRRSITLMVLLLTIAPKSVNAQNVMAFKTGERITGMTKQCYYTFGGNQYTRTIQAVQLCPLTIRVSSH